MRAIWISRHGGPEVLEVREGADPTVGPGEVRIRVEACGLNFAEVMARKGLYPDAPKPPCVVGYEAAGVVAEVGDGVAGPAVGTRVVALVRFGAHADQVVVPALQAVPIPDAMTFEQAAAIPVVYVTAYHMLFRVAALRPGDRVLVHMAAGGVGVAVLQLCRTVDDVEIFGTASPGKHDFLRELGCDHPIDYRSLDYAEEVRRLTDGRGVDLVLDPLGGRDWKKGYQLLRPAGRLVAFGFANMASGSRRSLLHVARQAVGIPLFTPMQLMNDNRTIAGVNLGHLWKEAAMLREEMDALLELFEAGRIEPHIDSTFPFEQAAEAHQRIESRANVGKVVLVPYASKSPRSSDAPAGGLTP
ncbi:MAG: zinc-binding dehydrogenase [Deltaproteobacteria bacterium]|nr:zinc-binding dehydrogenase [Deltaproteobacteria bacterium]MBW2537364.1 zinc-binding dehydrogenase [Deltaproteobacteria bacterium]